MSKHSQYQQNYCPPPEQNRAKEVAIDLALCIMAGAMLTFFLIEWIEASVK